MELLRFGMLATVSMAAILNPVAAVPTFLSMTPRNTTAERMAMAKRACWTAFGVLLTFALLGQGIFGVFGITLPSFQLAGGLILLLISLDNLRAHRSPVQETAEETDEGTAKDDISITPLAVPMLSGPGAITTIIMLDTKAAESIPRHITLVFALALVCGATYLIFRLAASGAKKINHTVMNVTTRLMGLMLAATGVEFILDALKSVGAIR
ncbi:MAG: NAAT family transporter [Elusimicrobiota bacterium]|jgi:multiple antibiotic resistance protein